MFELKSFFVGFLRTNDGKLSNEAIKTKVSEMIEEENQKNPLSDGEIASRLSKEGINIARRTVAKYRKELKIPPAYLRKKKS